MKSDCWRLELDGETAVLDRAYANLQSWSSDNLIEIGIDRRAGTARLFILLHREPNVWEILLAAGIPNFGDKAIMPGAITCVPPGV